MRTPHSLAFPVTQVMLPLQRAGSRKLHRCALALLHRRIVRTIACCPTLSDKVRNVRDGGGFHRYPDSSFATGQDLAHLRDRALVLRVQGLDEQRLRRREDLFPVDSWTSSSSSVG